MLLNIITPCSRPGNLEKLLNSIIYQIKDNEDNKDNYIKWYIMFDVKKVNQIPNFVNDWINQYKSIKIIAEVVDRDGSFGNQLRNRALDLIIEINDENWVFFLDDDNLLYPDYLKSINRIIQENGGLYGWLEGILGVQKLKDGLRLANNVAYGLIDVAQFTLKRKLIGSTRFDLYNYAADGIFIESIFKGKDNNGKENRNKFVITDDILCYYNKVTEG